VSVKQHHRQDGAAAASSEVRGEQVSLSGNPAAVPRLEMLGVSKHFASGAALSDVDLVVSPGEIHALIGQNGSGKSTLIKILAGYHAPDRGARVRVDGQELHMPARPRDLLHVGVSFVHQDLGLLDELTVLENMCVGRFKTHRISRHISWPTLEADVRDVMERLQLNVSPRSLVSELSAENRALVAIGRALVTPHVDSGLLVIDEATRALPAESQRKVHGVIRALTAHGGSVIIVTHNLVEVMAVADRVTVLRDGRVALAGRSTAGATESSIAKSLLGHDLKTLAAAGPRASSDARVFVRGVVGEVAANVDFTVGHGEVLGVTGVSGSGFDELPYLLTGVRRAKAGSLQIDADVIDLAKAGIARLQRLGIALVPERRAEEGLALDLSVGDNLTLPRLRSSGTSYFVGNAWRNDEIADWLARLMVQPADAGTPARWLSGGNQQKVLLAKWLAGSPRLLILHEPTQGVDVGARSAILEALRDEAGRGTAIVVASLEAVDLAEICDRVLVFRGGVIGAELRPRSADEIIDAVYAASTDELVQRQEGAP
jgi:ribose transport system ATP-binding protein